MDILNKAISSFVFDDIVVFCKEGNIEGFQLDYKREIPTKGLAKHFASFSNSRGGLIIVGVSEDKTGRPEKFEGIKLDGKIVDKIHQYATSVEPRPLYDLHVTKEQKGKVFVLVRIYEGDRTPYYVQNDPNIYVRTGNITDPIGLAGPEVVELLFGKKEKAKLARENYVFRSQEVYEAALRGAEKERLRLVAIEKENYRIQSENTEREGGTLEPYKSEYFVGAIGTKTAVLTTFLQPFFPGKVIMLPREIVDEKENIRFGSSDDCFPNYGLKPMQDGAIYFSWNQNNGWLKCQQLYSNGFLYSAEDVLHEDNRDGKRIYISQIVSIIFIFLKAASIYYRKGNYQGALIGCIRLNDIDGAKLKRIIPNGWRPSLFWDRENEIPLMDDYKWDLEIDTTLLDDDFAFQAYFTEKIREMYWSFGYGDLDEKLIKDFLRDNKWLVPEVTDVGE